MWQRKASQAVKEAASSVSIEAEVDEKKKAEHKRQKQRPAAASAAVAAEKHVDLELERPPNCASCGDAWESVEDEEPSRILRNCGVCLVAGICSERCAALHFRTQECIKGGEKPGVADRRRAWRETMRRWGVEQIETPLEKAEKAKSQRAAAAAAAKRAKAAAAPAPAAAAAVAAAVQPKAGSKRKPDDDCGGDGFAAGGGSDSDSTQNKKKKNKKAVAFNWPPCLSASSSKPCARPTGNVTWFEPCGDRDCPSRREAERLAFLVLTKTEVRKLVDSPDVSPKLVFSTKLAEALHAAGLRCNNPTHADTSTYAD